VEAPSASRVQVLIPTSKLEKIAKHLEDAERAGLICESDRDGVFGTLNTMVVSSTFDTKEAERLLNRVVLKLRSAYRSARWSVECDEVHEELSEQVAKVSEYNRN
jgi:hypothetical protein